MNDSTNEEDKTMSLSIESIPDRKGSSRMSVTCMPNFGYNEPVKKNISDNVPTLDEINEMAKQRYLIKEINDKNYNQNDFVDFIAKQNIHKLPEYQVLEMVNYTFDDLNNIVAMFQQKEERIRNPTSFNRVLDLSWEDTEDEPIDPIDSRLSNILDELDYRRK